MTHVIRSTPLVLPLIAAILAASPAQAQIVTDGSVGPKVSLSGGEIKIEADLGTRRGGNLFHSFEKFGIAPGQTATFTGPDSIRNVISRVTGGEISRIDGALRSEVGQADLYFLNPAGVVFGPNARLDVPASFHVSTAHELRFADGVTFSALDKAGSSLTVAPPEAFGFLDRSSGRIEVERSQLHLRLGKTFSLVGGDIAVTGTGGDYRKADGIESVGVEQGTVNLASTARLGNFRLSDGELEAAAKGSIRLEDAAEIAANGNGGGNIRIRGGVLTLDNSSVQAVNTGALNAFGRIDVQAGAVRMSKNSQISTDAALSGRGGGITIQASDLAMSDISSIKSDAAPRESSFGTGGPITVTAGVIDLVNNSRIGNGNNARERPGAVSVRGGRITLTNESSIDSTARTNSAGGSANITVNVINGGTLTLHDRSSIRSETRSNSPSTGEGSTVSVTAGTIDLRKAGGIRTDTTGLENAGNVIVHADRIVIDGAGTGLKTGLASGAGEQGSAGDRIGNAGEVLVGAGRIDLVNGGTIETQTYGGEGGTISVTAKHLLVAGLGNTGILSSALRENSGDRAGARGNAGSINVVADTIEIFNGAGIRSDTQTQGHGGTISLAARNLTIIGAGNNPAIDNDQTGITSDARTGSTGDAGILTINARNVTVRGGGLIRSNSRGTGNAGAIGIHTGNAGRLVISGDGSRSVTGISTEAQISSSGDAGQIFIQAGTILLRDEAVVSTKNANNTGAGGPISINVHDIFNIDRATVRSETESGNGGNVSLTIGRLLDLRGATVTTSAAGGEGSGGNISIGSHLIVLDDSRIIANAFGGPGGNITIVADQLIQNPESVIDASSKENVAGTITITSPNSDVMSGLVALPGTFLDAASRLRETCASRSGRPSSSIIAGGSGGLPPDPGAPVRLNPFGQAPAQRSAAGSTAALAARSARSAELVTVPGYPDSVLGSPRSACRG
jgi:filamentous hemagglutinin family protein